jgi:hypothetical protein
VTAAQDDQMAVLRADHLAAFALNRLGRHGEAAQRLFPAIRDADTPQGLRHELHVELAHCAAALGEPATALGAVHAVLAAGDDVAPVLRGGALVAVAEASAALGSDELVTAAFTEADELYREDPSLDHDTALLLRAAARAADAARHRRRGALAEAEAKAREGRELLAGLADPDHDSGEVSARLMLETVLALLDREAGDAAIQEVRPLLRRPVRAAAASAVGRLRLALATRVHLAEGRHEPALTLLADAVEGAQRHGMDAVLAECLEGLSHVHEARGEFADALHCMRAARAAEGRHRRNVEAARSTLLKNCGTARREEARLIGQVAALLGGNCTGCTGPDPDAGPSDAEAADTIAVNLTAELRVPGPEIAELEIPEAEIPELEISKTEVLTPEVPLMPAASGISRVESGGLPSELVDPLTAVKPVVEDPRSGSPEPVDLHSAESVNGLDPWHSRARHRRGTGTLVSVSDLLPASALSAGRSGRRRAEDRADEMSVAEVHQAGGRGVEGELPSDSSAAQEHEATSSVPAEGIENIPLTRREFPASGPPPAPTPRELEWEPADDDSAHEGEAHQMGLGDLLAEALAAYQESRDVHADTRTTGMCGDDGPTADDDPTADVDPTAADAETSCELPRSRGLATRWTTGLALAPNPIDRHDGDPSEAVTNPLLRLPDLTAEPRWSPPEPGRRSAAGD